MAHIVSSLMPMLLAHSQETVQETCASSQTFFTFSPVTNTQGSAYKL